MYCSASISDLHILLLQSLSCAHKQLKHGYDLKVLFLILGGYVKTELVNKIGIAKTKILANCIFHFLLP